MIIKNGLVFGADCKFSPRDVYFRNGRVVGEPDGLGGPADVYDADGCYVLPGFVDIHTHGAVDHDFCDADPGGVEAMLAYYGRLGVTSVVFATTSFPEDVIAGAVRAAAPYFRKDGYGAVLRGVNIEGPFLSLNKRGAQNPEFLTSPDLGFFERIFDIVRDFVRIVALAPELPGAMEFIRRAGEKCAVSIAHTEAGFDVASAAFDAGASHVTHLFNAMPPFTHREPGVVGAAMEKAGFVELISDGVHIHPAVIRAAFRMFGAHRVCLISDSMRATGMPDGSYEIGGLDVRVENGKAVLAGGNGAIAGSVISLPEMCRRAAGFGVPLEDAVRAATLNPAAAAGLSRDVGSLEPGKRADAVVWDKELRTKSVFNAGKRLS